jgi:hypothetical protein
MNMPREMGRCMAASVGAGHDGPLPGQISIRVQELAVMATIKAYIGVCRRLLRHPSGGRCPNRATFGSRTAPAAFCRGYCGANVDFDGASGGVKPMPA